MDTVLFLLHIRGLNTVSILFSRGGQIRGRKISREKNFSKIAKIYSTRKIGVIQYTFWTTLNVLLNVNLYSSAVFRSFR